MRYYGAAVAMLGRWSPHSMRSQASLHIFVFMVCHDLHSGLTRKWVCGPYSLHSPCLVMMMGTMCVSLIQGCLHDSPEAINVHALQAPKCHVT